MDAQQQWINDFNNNIYLIVDQIYKDQSLKELIANIKKATFWENTHNWTPLKPNTVKRKKYVKNLAGNPEDINIRTGDLANAFSSAVNVDISSDFKVSFTLTGTQADKLATVQQYGRDPEEITDQEYEEIVNYVVNTLVQKLQDKYGR